MLKHQYTQTKHLHITKCRSLTITNLKAMLRGKGITFKSEQFLVNSKRAMEYRGYLYKLALDNYLIT